MICVSLSVDPSVLVTGGGSVTLDRRGEQVIPITWVPTLLSCVIISQVGIENPKVLVNLQISRGSGVLAFEIFRGIFDRVGVVKGMPTGLLLYLRVYLLSSVQVLLISWASSVFGIYLRVYFFVGSDSDILSIFGSSSSGIFVVYERYCTWNILSTRFFELSSER